MPTITSSGPPISLEQKRELAKRLTEAASEVYKIPPPGIIVVILENPAENVSIGGTLLSDKKKKD